MVTSFPVGTREISGQCRDWQITTFRPRPSGSCRGSGFPAFRAQDLGGRAIAGLGSAGHISVTFPAGVAPGPMDASTRVQNGGTETGGGIDARSRSSCVVATDE